MGNKLIREMRGRLALYLTLAFVIATVVAAVVGQLASGTILAARLAYGGVSLLALAVVVMFGVGKWSRYLPEGKPQSSAAASGDARAQQAAPGGDA